MANFNDMLPAATIEELWLKTRRARTVAHRARNAARTLVDILQRQPPSAAAALALVKAEAAMATAEAQYARAIQRAAYVKEHPGHALRAAKSAATGSPAPAMPKLTGTKRDRAKEQIDAAREEASRLKWLAKEEAKETKLKAKYLILAAQRKARALAERARTARIGAMVTTPEGGIRKAFQRLPSAERAARTAEREAAAQAQDRAEQDRIDAKEAASIARAALRQSKRTE